MDPPISADEIYFTGNRNPNPNSGDRSHAPPNPADDRDQRLHHLFSAVQNLAVSRDSSDSIQSNPFSVDPLASSFSRKRPLQTDFFREVSLFNAHFSSEPEEKSWWAQFLPEYLRPGNLENYLEQTDEPQLFGDNFWWASQESSGQDCNSRLATVNQGKMPEVKDGQKDLQVKSVSEAILKINQEIEVEFLGVNQIIEHGATLVGSSGARRESESASKEKKEEKKSFTPRSQTNDHIQYSRDQLLQLREVKSISEAILKIKQDIEVEFLGVNQIIGHGATLVGSSGARKESGSTSKEKEEEKKVASITVNAREEPKIGDKANQEEVLKKKKRGRSDEKKAKRKMKERKKRAEKNRKLGVNRLTILPIQKQKPVSHCRHYINGRCYEGETCKFSHDVVPKTKAKPCCHFARQACMKGDDCPFDHQLSKYPCNNYVSAGFCKRAESCLFSHEIKPEQNSVCARDIIQPETKSLLNPSTSSASIQLIKSPSTLEKGSATVGIGTANKPAQEWKGRSSGNFPSGTCTNHKLANLASKGTSKESPASANEPVKPPKGFTFLNLGKLPPNESASGGQASQKTSNGVEAGVLSNQGMISNASNQGKISEAPLVPTSNVTDIFTFGKSSSDNHGVKQHSSSPTFGSWVASAGDKKDSSRPLTDIFTFGRSASDNHGEKKQSSFSTFGNSSLAASAGDKMASVDPNQKPNVVPFKFPASTSSSTPFLTRLDNPQVSSGQRSLLSTLGFASKFDSGATRNPLIITPATRTDVNNSGGTDHSSLTQQTESPMNVNPCVGTSASSDANKSPLSSSGSSTGPKEPANPFEMWAMLCGGSSQSKP